MHVCFLTRAVVTRLCIRHICNLQTRMNMMVAEVATVTALTEGGRMSYTAMDIILVKP